MKDIVTDKVAKELKLCGYHENVTRCYRLDTGELVYHYSVNDFNSVDNCLSAPAITEAMLWLWERFGLWVDVTPQIGYGWCERKKGDATRFNFGLHFDEIKSKYKVKYGGALGFSYEPRVAMLAGISAACEYVQKFHKKKIKI